MIDPTTLNRHIALMEMRHQEENLEVRDLVRKERNQRGKDAIQYTNQIAELTKEVTSLVDSEYALRKEITKLHRTNDRLRGHK